MPAPEPARRALYARLEEVLGHEHAETLMTHLPPQEAESLATKADVADVRAAVADVRTEVADVRTEVADVRTEVQRLGARFDQMEDRFDRLEARFDTMDERFYGLQETLRDQFRSYSQTMIWAMTGLTGIFSAIVVILR